jgi:hypothetical protein
MPQSGRRFGSCPAVPTVACLGNPDPVDMKVYCPTGKETFNDEKTEEALLLLLMLKKPLVRSLDGLG